MAGVVLVFKGGRGRGKTLAMTALGKVYKDYKWPIYSNYSVTFAKEKESSFFLNLTKDNPLRNCVFLIDELAVLFDSRNFKDKSAITFSHFLMQLRKRNIVILGTTQFMDTIDKRIRQQMDIIGAPKFNKITKMVSLRFFDVTSLEDNPNAPKFRTFSFYAPKIYKYYDTNEIIST